MEPASSSALAINADPQFRPLLIPLAIWESKMTKQLPLSDVMSMSPPSQIIRLRMNQLPNWTSSVAEAKMAFIVQRRSLVSYNAEVPQQFRDIIREDLGKAARLPGPGISMSSYVVSL